MSKYAKAIVSGVGTLVTSAVAYLLGADESLTAQISTVVTGVITTVLVYWIPNSE